MTRASLALLLGFAGLVLATAGFWGGTPTFGAPTENEGSSVSRPDGTELARIFARFSHKRHNSEFAPREIGCIACHQVGAVGDPRILTSSLEAAVMPPPAKSCHFCHNPSTGQPPTGAGRCILCHDQVKPPESHGAGWREVHGTEARLQTWSCDNCHRRAFCIDCHELKQPNQGKVHDGAWMTVHPIAARSNPSKCSTCHLQVDCVACHSSTSGRPQ